MILNCFEDHCAIYSFLMQSFRKIKLRFQKVSEALKLL